MKLDEKIRGQNEEYYEIYDYIMNNMSKYDQIKILETNREVIPDTDAQVNEEIMSSKFKLVDNKNVYAHFISFARLYTI